MANTSMFTKNSMLSMVLKATNRNLLPAMIIATLYAIAFLYYNASGFVAPDVSEYAQLLKQTMGNMMFVYVSYLAIAVSVGTLISKKAVDKELDAQSA